MSAPPPLTLHPVTSLAAFSAAWAERRTRLGPGMAFDSTRNDAPFTVAGYCQVDRDWVEFQMDALYSGEQDGRLQLNWRERMVCPRCGLNNRQRAAFHAFFDLVQPQPDDRVWLTEQTTALYQRLSRHVPHLIGSEFLGPDYTPGTIDARGLRHEDMSQPSFAPGELAAILSFDVLEHVPDIDQALAASARALRPGGHLLFTVPFLYVVNETRQRAERLPDGSIVHHWPAQYHGDPVNPNGGILCYNEFGWDLLKRLRRAGFAHAAGILYESDDYGYVGGTQILFHARKANHALARTAALVRKWPRFRSFAGKLAQRFVTLSKRPDRHITLGPATGPAVNRSTRSYAERVSAELTQFTDCAQVHDLPAIFHYWSGKYLLPKCLAFGFSHPDEFFVNPLTKCLAAGGARRIVSIGAGNCDTEVRLAVALKAAGHSGFVLECLELNPAMLKRGRDHAAAQGVADLLDFVEADFNTWQPGQAYAAVMANQSLHHVVALEHLFSSIQSALQPGGRFIVADIIGRNGHQRWPEALAIVHEFWRELPREYRFNLLLNRHEELYENWDCSASGFEGIRAQEVLPLLIEHFYFEDFLAFSNVIDPFIDRAFGHHFKPERAWDRDFIDRLEARDEADILAGRITPTHLFAVMTREACASPRLYRAMTPAACVRKFD